MMTDRTLPVDPEVLEQEQLAAMLGVEISTLADWRRKGYGPPFARLKGERGRVRYLRSDVIAWLKARQRVHEVATA